MVENKEKKHLAIDRVTAVNCFDLAPEFVTAKNSHDAWEFVYVDSGRIVCCVGAKEQLLSQGQMIFHRPREVHSTAVGGKGSAAIFSVIFECPSPAMEYFDGRVLSIPADLMPRLKGLIHESGRAYHVSDYPLRSRADAPVGAEQIIRNDLETLLLLLMRRGGGEAPARGGVEEVGKHRLSEEICEYLKEHLCERVTLEMLSERFHFGKVYLCDVFKRNTGSSILSFHLDLKIAEAKCLLRETRMSVWEIAEFLGFESASYFSRIFKKRVGHPPQSFRKMLINSYAVRRER
jgi:AraC-like DNA-binding protein/quercetin dioxygenase-like cupin family protein